MFIKCKVIGKQRPRFKKVGGYVQTYTPKPTKDLENLIAQSYTGKCYDTPLKVEITAIFEPPQSISKKKRSELIANEEHTKKPDVDNIAKLVLDGLNGIAYLDDKQVIELNCKKKYGETEGIDIKINEQRLCKIT